MEGNSTPPPDRTGMRKKGDGSEEDVLLYFTW